MPLSGAGRIARPMTRCGDPERGFRGRMFARLAPALHFPTDPQKSGLPARQRVR